MLRNGIPVVHVASTNKSYDGWNEFRMTVAESSGGSPQPLMIEVVEEKLEELGQPFPWRPFALGRSIGVERLEGSGTMGGICHSHRQGWRKGRMTFRWFSKRDIPSAVLLTNCSVSMVSPTTTLSIFPKRRTNQVSCNVSCSSLSTQLHNADRLSRCRPTVYL